MQKIPSFQLCHRWLHHSLKNWQCLFSTSAVKEDSLLVECQSHDQKIASSNPGRSCGIIFFSRVNFVCWLIRCPFHPGVTTVACKRPQPFCQKCRWQTTPKHARTLPSKVGVGLLCHCPGTVWEPVRRWACTQLVKEHLATVISACWATVDWSWPKEWNWCVQADLHFKKKKVLVGNDSSTLPPKFWHVRKMQPPPQFCC